MPMPELPTATPGAPQARIFLPGLTAGFLILGQAFLAGLAPGWVATGIVLTVLCVAGVLASEGGSGTARILAQVILGLYWTVLGALFVQFILAGFGLFAPVSFVIAVIVAWSTLVARRGLGSKRAGLSAAIGFAIGTITIGSLVVAAMVKAVDHQRPTPPPDPKVLGQDMLTVVKCNLELAASHPTSGYAESLSQMGPGGTGCLPQRFLALDHQGFSFAYQHGVKHDDGKITHFTIRAEQALPHGADFSTISSDESGMVLYSYQGPRGKGTPLLYSPVAGTFDSLMFYLRIFADAHRRDLQQADLSIQKDMADQGFGVAKGEVHTGQYNFTYRFDTDSSGTINGFVIEGRPRTYGVGGLRSYLVLYRPESGIQTLTAFVTAEDRPATTSDSLAYMCEIKPGTACTTPAQVR